VLLALDRHHAEREAAGAAGQPRAAVERLLFARVVQADAAAEEKQQIFFRRPKARRRSRIARDVAEVEDARILEEELPLFWEEETELREVDLLLVGFGLRESGLTVASKVSEGVMPALMSTPAVRS
jgi:hypothetical protein